MLKCWANIPGYVDFVKEEWRSIQVHGWSGFVLREKLKRIKGSLRQFLWLVVFIKSFPKYWLTG